MDVVPAYNLPAVALVTEPVGPRTPANRLNVKESELMFDAEVIIRDGLDVFEKVGAALLTIRDGRLYRERYGTFEAYCKERWKLGSRQARNYIAASEVMSNLKEKPEPTENANHDSGPPATVKALPSSERVARPLAKLKGGAEQRAAWEEAKAKANEAGRDRVQARDVEEVVSLRKQKKNSPYADGERPGILTADESKALAAEAAQNRWVMILAEEFYKAAMDAVAKVPDFAPIYPWNKANAHMTAAFMAVARLHLAKVEEDRRR
jgi:hypothetical protein